MSLNRNSATYPVSRLGAISDGIEGTRETLAMMRDLVRTFRVVPEMRALGEEIIYNIPQKDYAAEIEAVFNFVRASVRYTEDIYEVETLKDPITLLQTGTGDCDDMSTLLATLLNVIGKPARFLAVGFAPGEFEHVLVLTKIGPNWIPLDPTEPHRMGWKPPGIVQRLEWRI